MRWLLSFLLALVATVTLSVAVLVYLVPDTAIERHILAAAGRATNTEITTAGLPEISLFPAIDLTLRGVEVRPRDTVATMVLTARKVHAEVSWLSILTQWTVDIGELMFVEPKLQILSERPARREAVAMKPRRRLYPPPAVVIRQVGIEDGVIDGISDWRIKNIDATVPILRPDADLDVDLSFYLNAEKVVGTVKMKEAAALRSGGDSPVVADFVGDSGKIHLDGHLSLVAGPTFVGKVALSTADFDASSRWLGLAAAPQHAGKPASLSGNLRYSGGSVDLNDAKVVFAD